MNDIFGVIFGGILSFIILIFGLWLLDILARRRTKREIEEWERKFGSLTDGAWIVDQPEDDE